MNNGTYYSGTYSSTSGADTASNLTDAVVDTMVRWPMRMTGAAVDMMIRGAQSMTGSGRSMASNGYNASSSSDSTRSSSSSSSSGSSGWSTLFSNQSSGTFDQDLSGDDLKYVIWSIVFTKPGYECILQKQQEELVNYSADSSTYAAVKIAKFLDSARHGHSDRPEAWGDKGYPSDASKPKSSRKESTTVISTPGSTSVATSSSGASESRASGSEQDKGWRIPPEDQKFICFLYRVDRRMPKQEEVTRVERVTVERNTRVV
jgi:hypothetical protein